MLQIINKNLINTNLKGNTKKEVISELAQMIDNEGRLSSFEAYCNNVFEREEMSTTGIGFGIAIPHGKCMEVNVPTVAFGRKNDGIDWQSLDSEPAKIVFLIAVPDESESNLHLKILAALSRKLMDEDFREELINIDDEESILKMMQELFEKVGV